MQYQDGQMEEPTMASPSRDYQHIAYSPHFTQHSPLKNVLKHGFIAGAILAGIVIVTTAIFTNPVISNALFSTFARTYFLGLLHQGNIVISLIVTALCTPIYFFIGYRTRKYSALACLIAVCCFLFVDAFSYLVIFLGSAPSTSLKEKLVVYIFAFLFDLFLALIVGFGLTAIGTILRHNQEGKKFLKY